jgi:hypothetical protein
MVLTRTLDLLFYAAIATAFVASPFLIVNWAKFYMKKRSRAAFPAYVAGVEFPIKSVVFFVTASLVVLVTGSAATTVARQTAVSFLQQPPEQLHVLVNGRPVQNGDEIVLSLRAIASHSAHHSHPTTHIRVEIRHSQRNLVLELGRDSGIPREYWVFCPTGGITSSNEIGRITSPLFDGY